MRQPARSDTQFRWLRRWLPTVAAVATMIVSVTLIATGAGHFGDRVDAAKQQAQQAQQLAEAIKRSRRDFIMSQCRETNRRHDKTIAALRKGNAQSVKRAPAQLIALFTLAGVHVPPDAAKAFATFEQAATAASFKSTVLLIDALDPPQNCQQITIRYTTR